MNYQLLLGDNRTVLRTLPDQSVHCIVTSPPYYGLRDYGVDGQIGLEATPEQYVAELVNVFRECWRVLRDDGTLWLNLGDSYAGYWGDKKAKEEGRPSSADTNGWTNGFNMNARPSFHSAFQGTGIKPKDLIGIPWLVAFALRADGWYLRSDIIWHKPNPMPESVTDRPTKAHEYIFLLTKSQRYYYDAEAVKEAVSLGTHGGSWTEGGKKQTALGQQRGGMLGNSPLSGYRNRRSVWTVATVPYSGAHFATFPPALIEPCILAGCPEGGTVLDPFNGSGTTGAVACAHNRNYIGIDLSADYIELSHVRIREAINESGRVPVIRRGNASDLDSLPMFAEVLA